jgi:hypothetical protein
MCTDYPKATWSEADAMAACEASLAMAGATIDEWADVNCAVDQFPTTWRCAATSDGITSVPTYYNYAESLPLGICAGVLLGTVEERGSCWEDYDQELSCPDISPGIDTWSCRATVHEDSACVDYPTATWSFESAEENCEAAAEQFGGQIDSWSEVNCAVDNFDTTWRCVATSDGMESVPVYYVYAETLPLGICNDVYMGEDEYRQDGCWTDYDMDTDTDCDGFSQDVTIDYDYTIDGVNTDTDIAVT